MKNCPIYSIKVSKVEQYFYYSESWNENRYVIVIFNEKIFSKASIEENTNRIKKKSKWRATKKN